MHDLPSRTHYRKYFFERNRNKPLLEVYEELAQQFPERARGRSSASRRSVGRGNGSRGGGRSSDMRLLSLLFTNLLAFFLVTPCAPGRRSDLVGAVPSRWSLHRREHNSGSRAVIAAATAVVSLINNTIGGLLNAVQGTIGSINGVLTQFRQLLGASRLSTSVDKPGARTGQFDDCPIPRASDGAAPCECFERTTAKSGCAGECHAGSQHGRLRTIDHRLWANLPGDSPTDRCAPDGARSWPISTMPWHWQT